MPRSAASLIDVRRWVGAAAVGAALAFGLVSERIAYGWDKPVRWVPDLIVGLVLVIAGLGVAAARGTGVLLAATGTRLVRRQPRPLALYWHRGPLVHLLLSYPRVAPPLPA